MPTLIVVRSRLTRPADTAAFLRLLPRPPDKLGGAPDVTLTWLDGGLGALSHKARPFEVPRLERRMQGGFANL